MWKMPNTNIFPKIFSTSFPSNIKHFSCFHSRKIFQIFKWDPLMYTEKCGRWWVGEREKLKSMRMYTCANKDKIEK